MHNPQVTIRFGLMLEAYFRGSGDHLDGLTRQVRRNYNPLMLNIVALLFAEPPFRFCSFN